MSAYTTIDITRKTAEDMVRKVREKQQDPVSQLSDKELDKELHKYVYSGQHSDIVGVLYNYKIHNPIS